MDQGRSLKLKFGEIVFFGLLFFSGLSIVSSLEIEPKEECGVIERRNKLTQCKENINVIRSFCLTKYFKEVETCEVLSVLGLQDFKICYQQVRREFKQCTNFQRKYYKRFCYNSARICQYPEGYPSVLTTNLLMENIYGSLQIGTSSETLQLWRQVDLNRQTNPTSFWGWNGLNSNYYYGELPDYTRSVNDVDSYQSPCSNGNPGADQYSYTCPHMAMFSPDMLYAASYESLESDFYFAIAGTSSDTNCGNCYQVKPSNPLQASPSNPKQFIIQAFNYGGDVAAGQFDVFMGGGGFGLYTVCNANCEKDFCSGGACLSDSYAMFQGSFNDWTNSTTVQYQNVSRCLGGGVKANVGGNYSNTITEIKTKCGKLVPFDPFTVNYETLSLKDQFVYQSCLKSNENTFHQNWLDTEYKRVQCPASLYKMTGMKPTDDSSQPLPDATTTTWDGTFAGDVQKGLFGITTMQDCCKPSCAWPYKGNADNNDYPAIFSCNKNGFINGYQ